MKNPSKINFLLSLFFSLFFAFLIIPEGQAKVALKVFKTPELALKGWHNEDHSVPVVSMVISFRAGGCYAPEAKAGLAAMLAGMLTEGAGPFTTQQFHEKLDTLGIELDVDADFDRLLLTMRTPRQHLDEALKLLRLVLHKPRFDHGAFDRLKKSALASVTNQSQTPGWLAARHLAKNLYGAHPYARAVGGTPQSLETINVRDVGRFMKDHFSLDRVRLSASGDITEVDLIQRFDALLKGLPQKGFRRQLGQIKVPEQGSVWVHKTPHPQATILFAHKGLAHSHEDFMKYYVIDYVFGSGGESRLMQEIRDQAGLVYTASTGVQSFRYVSLLSGYLGTKGPSAHDAVEKVKKMFTQLRDKGLSQKELDFAKKHLIGRFPMGFTSSKQIALAFHAYQVYGFQPDYLDKREQMIRALTLKDINDFAKRFFKPESLIFSVAGDVPGGLGNAHSKRGGVSEKTSKAARENK